MRIIQSAASCVAVSILLCACIPDVGVEEKRQHQSGPTAGLEAGSGAVGQHKHEESNQGPMAAMPEIMDMTAAEQVQVSPSKALHARTSPGIPLQGASSRGFVEPHPTRENYGAFSDNGVIRVASNPVSTLSIDVDTGAYANVRRILNQGRLPQRNAVRIEELINYFDYAYDAIPQNGSPFGITTDLGPTPWNPNTRLIHVGINAMDASTDQISPANLVFLIDVSGSMQTPNKLGLLKSSLKMLSRQMSKRDRISIVVYAGASGVVLEAVPGNDTLAVEQAIDTLSASGSTNGGAGIHLAYKTARKAYIDGGINRIILATDGDFNVGVTDFGSLISMIERERKSGISLTTLGFGDGNYNDHLMEQLADSGNGNYAYIDTLGEARKVLVDELSSVLNTVAKDVKIQIEFNPNVVVEYRLIGYENRILKREDFNNDRVDAGEIGSGHTVTALYEISLLGSPGQSVDPLRYQGEKSSAAIPEAAEAGFLKIRYKTPDGTISQLLEHPILLPEKLPQLNAMPERYRFSAAVAAFGQLLRDSHYINDFGWQDIHQLAVGARGQDSFGYRAGFLTLLRLAEALDSPAVAVELQK